MAKPWYVILLERILPSSQDWKAQDWAIYFGGIVALLQGIAAVWGNGLLGG